MAKEIKKMRENNPALFKHHKKLSIYMPQA
jgi:hypothetical protein